MIVNLMVVLLLICTGISGYVVRTVLYPKTKAYDFTREKEVADGWFTNEWFDGLAKEEFYVASPHGYKIHCIWLPLDKSKKTVILVHGYSYSLFGSVKYVDMFRRLGFNVLVYDHRFHGRSGGGNTTFGWKEKDDLGALVTYVSKRIPHGTVGAHGESMGGGTALMFGAEDNRLDFIISDCAYADMGMEIAYRMKEDHGIPAFPIIYMASFISKLFTGIFFHQVSPMKAAAHIKVPTMIIHGTADAYTPPEQGEMIFRALRCPKAKYEAIGADHAKAFGVDRERYFEEVKAFLIDNQFIDD